MHFVSKNIEEYTLEILDIQNISKLQRPCVITIGMFDGVHIGHRQMLEELKLWAERCSAASVVVTFSNHPRQILDKNSDNPIKFIDTKSERFQKIASCGVDFILPIEFTKAFASLTPMQFLDVLLEKMDIRLLLLGYDNRFGNPKNNEYETLLKDGFYKNIKIQKDVSGVYYNDIEVSSTQIRNAITSGKIKTANAMLSEPYCITSKVINGLQNGRKIGFPTANIIIPDNKILPQAGVYATKTIIDNQIYNSITNIGNNPTFEANATTVETHIMDFKDDIYQKEITVKFLDFIRQERKFDTAEDLSDQINKDLMYAKDIFNNSI